MASVAGDFELTMDELRVVARFVVESAQEVLAAFEGAVPGDPRPRAAVDSAWEFVNGAKRTKLQRVTSLDAGDDPVVGDMLIEQARQRATPVLINVLRRYPLAPTANNRVARLMSTLDSALRASR